MGVLTEVLTGRRRETDFLCNTQGMTRGRAKLLGLWSYSAQQMAPCELVPERECTPLSRMM